MADFNFELLKEKAVVTFIKKDGSERRMICTKNMNLIAEEFHPKGTGRAKNPETVSVWDIEKEAWRSFNKASVISIEPFSEKQEIKMSIKTKRMIIDIFCGCMLAQIMSFYASDCFPNWYTILTPTFTWVIVLFGVILYGFWKVEK